MSVLRFTFRNHAERWDKTERSLGQRWVKDERCIYIQRWLGHNAPTQYILVHTANLDMFTVLFINSEHNFIFAQKCTLKLNNLRKNKLQMPTKYFTVAYRLWQLQTQFHAKTQMSFGTVCNIGKFYFLRN